MDKTLRTVIIVCICVITLSVFYYFVIFLPKEREAIRKAEQAEKATKEEAERAEKVRKELAQIMKESEKWKDYNECIRAVDKDYHSNWESNCQSLRLGSECSLPLALSDRLNRSKKESEEQCYKLSFQSQ